jgi:hypothetical protein
VGRAAIHRQGAAPDNLSAQEFNMFIAIAISTIAVTIAVYGIALWLDPPPRR